MSSIYENRRIPLQIRRMMFFAKICHKARTYPDEIVYFSSETQLAFSAIYFEESKNYIAYGGVFEYSYMSNAGTEETFDIPKEYDLELCEISLRKIQFTKSVNSSIKLWWRWNKHVKKQLNAYLYDYQDHMIQVKDETDMGYNVNDTTKCLLASAKLPLWNNMRRLKA